MFFFYFFFSTRTKYIVRLLPFGLGIDNMIGFDESSRSAVVKRGLIASPGPAAVGKNNNTVRLGATFMYNIWVYVDLMVVFVQNH